MIIFIGISGSGKSLQGKLLADKMGYPWLSTGEFLRMLLSGPARQAMVSGELVADDQVLALFDKMLGLIDLSQEFVVDGFPRTVNQTQWLLRQVNKGRFNISSVFHLNISEETARKRLLARGRLDDQESSIDKRFSEYQEVTIPLLEALKQAGVVVHDINADRPTDQIQENILKLAQG